LPPAFELPPALAGGQQIQFPILALAKFYLYNCLAKALILY
jgi:hypothetical protein